MTSTLRPFGERLWIADGPNVRFLGASLPTRMIVAKLGDGSLWINSPVEASEATFAEISALGRVRYLVAPTPLHVWRLVSGHRRFPDAELWGPPKVPRGAYALAFAGLLGGEQPALWAETLEHVVFRGNAFVTEVEFLHRPSRTLVMTDFIQNYRAVSADPVGNVIKRVGGVLGCGVPLDIRLSFVYRDAARRSLAKLLSWDFDRLVIAHGDCLDRDGKGSVTRAFRWLKRNQS